MGLKRMARHGVSEFGGRGVEMEPLEGRQMLAADLAVSWDTSHFRVPAVLVPGDHFNPTGGAQRLEAPITLSNLGPSLATGTVRVDFYLSTDTTLDANNDFLVKSFADVPVSIGAGGSMQFSPDMTVPANLAPGSYHLIVKITPNGSLADSSAANNVTATADPISVERRFGTFDGRTNVVMTLETRADVFVQFKQTGGGYGEVVEGGTGLAVTLNGSGDFTRTTIRVTGWNAFDHAYDLASLTINGSIGTFDAPDARVRGTISATTGFGTMIFGDVLTLGTTISVPASSFAPSFTFGRVRELSIDSAVGIKSITATEWLDLSGAKDFIRAPWLTKLAIAGNFYPSIFLSGGSETGALETLDTVNIGGVIKAGSWSVNGFGGSVHAYATAAGWSATFAAGLGEMRTDGSFRGVLTGGQYLQSIQSGKDILAGKILAGAYLGQDGRLGGSGADADVYGQGHIGGLDVARNVAGCLIASGLNPMDGVFGNGDDVIEGGWRSDISQVYVGHIIGRQVRLIANVYGQDIDNPFSTTAIHIGGSLINPKGDARFAWVSPGPEVTVQSTNLGDQGGSLVATIRVRIVSAGLVDLSHVTAGAVKVIGPGGTPTLPGLASNVAWDGNVNDGTAAFATFTVRLTFVGQIATPGTYSIVTAGGVLTDRRGNEAAEQEIGAFVVS